jgi:hypothetical protein
MSPDRPSPKQGTEFFYDTPDGPRDAALHERILAEGDEEAAKDVTRQWMRENGYTEDVIRLLLPH